jgi:hypothetical protein
VEYSPIEAGRLCLATNWQNSTLLGVKLSYGADILCTLEKCKYKLFKRLVLLMLASFSMGFSMLVLQFFLLSREKHKSLSVRKNAMIYRVAKSRKKYISLYSR